MYKWRYFGCNGVSDWRTGIASHRVASLILGKENISRYIYWNNVDQGIEKYLHFVKKLLCSRLIYFVQYFRILAPVLSPTPKYSISKSIHTTSLGPHKKGETAYFKIEAREVMCESSLENCCLIAIGSLKFISYCMHYYKERLAFW